MKSGILFLVYLVSFLNVFAGEHDWGKLHKKDGITCRYRNVEGSKFQEFQAQVVVKAKISSVVAILRDTKNWHKWSYCGKKAELLQLDGNDVYQYIETEIPWPFPNRDLVYHCQYNQNPKNYEVEVKINGLPNYIPKKKNIVRVQYTKGLWKIKPLQNGHVQITFQMHIESSGNVPAWFTNVATSESPFKTLTNLRERLKLKQYQNCKFDFITDPF